MNLERQYADYRNQLRKLEAVRDAWYTIANQKFSDGDEDGEGKAYDEAEAVAKKIMALVDPLASKK